MDESRKKAYLELQKNAKEILDALDTEKFELAVLDRLLRERNATFLKLKDVLNKDSVDAEEETLMQGMISDNYAILQRIEEKKKEMESALNKKVQEANKISKYSHHSG